MEYKGNIGIDMTGGDVVKGKIFLERAIKYTKIVLRKHPDYRFFLAGSADILNQVGLPGNPGNKRIVNAEEDSLTTLLNIVDKHSLDAIVTHEGAKKLQKSLAKAHQDGLSALGDREKYQRRFNEAHQGDPDQKTLKAAVKWQGKRDKCE